MDQRDFDIVVIGAGVGGYTAANRAGQLGLSVACIEGAPDLGGTCLNVGCIPSKSLLHASELFDTATHKFADLGILINTPQIDVAKMMQQKDASLAALRKGIEYLFKKNKVERITGWAKLKGPCLIEVTGADGDITAITYRNVIIATGSEPSALKGVTVDQQRIVDSTGALTLPSVPKRLVVIGGGTIGLELGSVWRRLGSEVEVVEFLDRVAAGADAAISAALKKTLEGQGFKFRLSTEVLGVEDKQSGLVVNVRDRASGEAAALAADVVLVATGRRPFTKGLGLETVGVEIDARGYIPTTGFATVAPGVWAIGDVTLGPMLAHKAEDEGVACAETIAGKFGHVNYDIIPSVIYTTPEVSWVGLTEEQVKANGKPFKVSRFPFSANSRAKLSHEPEGFVKLISSTDDYRVLGVHMIGPGVSELIGEVCIAMEFRADSEDIARTCHPHPTRSEALRQAAMGIDNWMTQA